MPSKLTDVEKAHVANVIEVACRGTPLQPNAEFAGGYLGNVVVSLMENWEETRKHIHTDGTKTTVAHSDIKRRKINGP